MKKIDSCTLRTRSEPLWGAVRIPTVNRFPQDYAPFNRKTTRGLELKTNILARQWMCGIPETLVIIDIDGEFVISAFGADDIIQTLKTNTTAQYASATVVVETAVTE